MLALAQKVVQTIDSLFARVYLAALPEKSGLIGLLFHALFRDLSEIEQNAIDPLQRTTTDELGSAIEYYLANGYKFIRPEDLLAGVKAGQKYVQLTFDDGYFSNTLALPLLERYNVPALVFISTDNVVQAKSFWWDVLYRERLARGASRRQIYREAVSLKQFRTEEIEAHLTQAFGKVVFRPRGDIDRPFTPNELRRFSKHPLISIGNHTANHAILTNYDEAGLFDQLDRCQQSLLEMTGKLPIAIAYPNGDVNQRVISACKRAGLQLGYTTDPVKSSATPLDLFQMGRFAPGGTASVRSQCHTYRSDLTVYRTCRSAYLSTWRPRRAR